MFEVYCNRIFLSQWSKTVLHIFNIFFALIHFDGRCLNFILKLVNKLLQLIIFRLCTFNFRQLLFWLFALLTFRFLPRWNFILCRLNRLLWYQLLLLHLDRFMNHWLRSTILSWWTFGFLFHWRWNDYLFLFGSFDNDLLFWFRSINIINFWYIFPLVFVFIHVCFLCIIFQN